MKRIIITLSIVILALVANAKPPTIAVAQFFDGRYDKEKTVSTSISKDNGIYYRGLHVVNNPGIVKNIYETLKKDASNATKYSEQTGEGGTSVLIKLTNNGEIINIGFQQAPSGQNATLFIKGPDKAFK